MPSTTLPAKFITDPALANLQDDDLIWVFQDADDYIMTGAQLKAGVLAGRPHDIHGQMPGVPAANTKWVYPMNRAAVLPEDLIDSHAGAQVAATASTTFTLYKGVTSIGTINFAAAATVGTFTFAADVSFVAGDLLTVQAPATPDATLAGFYFNLAGTLT